MPRYKITFAGPDAPKHYKLLHEAVGVHRSGKARKLAARSAFKALKSIGVDAGEALANGDFPLRTLPPGTTASLEVSEGERNLMLDVIGELELPTFGIDIQDAVSSLLENAERLPEPASKEGQ